MPVVLPRDSQQQLRDSQVLFVDAFVVRNIIRF
jgi:hypothetical protein